ncbi:Stearoyl-CoA desaturase 5 [Camelus dromedarius]|uniref:Stearoyl-CoA desaturase 5 n=1 Tax=Camelus dromedarius TaxID=9838 RepID=A0A5N4EGT8_CAMDR|nr:Stearoyl-CoA desaturase 5 [Camelus dromedarius]
MPGPAADGGKAPFGNAKGEIRAGVGVEDSEGGGGRERPGARGQRQNIVWRNVVLMSLLHLGAVYSLVLIPKAQPLTLLWAYHSPTVLGVPFLEQALAGGMSESEDFRKDPGAHTLEQVCSGARRIPWAGQS